MELYLEPNMIRFYLILRIGLFYLHETKGMGNAGPTYHITRDFIFQSTPRHDLIYNPEYLEIVKRINLQPLIMATDVLRQLMARYNYTCDKMDREWVESSRSNRFTRITPKGATVMEGVSTCKKLG